jgi:acyl carrier protein
MTTNLPADQSASAHAGEQIVALVGKTLYLDSSDVDLDQPFTEAGMDSILAVEFIAEVRRELGLSLTVATLYEHNTPRKFADFVARQGTGATAAVASGHDANDRDAGQVASSSDV